MYLNSIFMAFDFGTKSIGVAIGQNVTFTANPLKSIKVKFGIPDWNEINNLLKEWDPKIIIVGLPLNIKGMEQPITIKARKFAYLINNLFGIKVILHDERFSTVEAKSLLFNKGKYKYLSKSKIDAESAVIILESWLNKIYLKNNNN